MSYSFNVRAQTKEAAKTAVAEKFAEVVAQQLVHEKDRAAVLENAGAVIDLLHGNPDRDQSKDISVSVNGYVSWTGADAADLNTVSVSSTASYVDRAPA
jgi:hypothetical protein